MGFRASSSIGFHAMLPGSEFHAYGNLRRCLGIRNRVVGYSLVSCVEAIRADRNNYSDPC